ncbi:MAG: pilus assembly protein CpaE [Chloroflexota bacterium]|nr:pilus assembly protein CpaE [Chloroflexota bacterium]PLS80030.1 MAG: pilus assembly protein CpaE [Chloroflexota bacterium]
MIDPGLAQQLKEAGLEWQPTKRDNFMIPGGELAKDVFSLNDQTILVENVKGQTTVTFHGSTEWALDDVLLADIVWLPTETQLREAVQQQIAGDDGTLSLVWNADGYRCGLRRSDEEREFVGQTAEDAYGYALLFLLRAAQQERNRRWINTA